ncbi:MAG: hypothetical protein RI965_37 [Bacteroidota bacterium]|jgi:hypothetical protein
MKLLALNVYFFLATTCPISQQYTAYINQFTRMAAEKHIQVMLVFPTEKNKIKTEVDRFIQQYKLSAPVIVDKGFKLSKKFNATVTPEVFVLNEKDQVLYHGAIDNWFYKLGQNRIEITEHYLDDAVGQALNQQPIIRPYIKPIGCFIETGIPNN